MVSAHANRRQASHLHLWVLALCVAACLAVASVPRAGDRSSPEDDAGILIRAVLGVSTQGEQTRPAAR